MMPINQVNISNYNSIEKIKIKTNKKSVSIKNKEKTKENSFTHKIGFKDFQKIKEQSKNDIEAFKKFISKIISYQGNHKGKSINLKIDINIKLEKNSSLEDNEESEAKLDDYWGAEATSKRILDFAKKISGGNPEKIDLLIDGFKKGYEEAKKCFGGELPGVCEDTYDLVMEGFEELKNQNEAVEIKK